MSSTPEERLEKSEYTMKFRLKELLGHEVKVSASYGPVDVARETVRVFVEFPDGWAKLRPYDDWMQDIDRAMNEGLDIKTMSAMGSET